MLMMISHVAGDFSYSSRSDSEDKVFLFMHHTTTSGNEVTFACTQNYTHTHTHTHTHTYICYLYIALLTFLAAWAHFGSRSVHNFGSISDPQPDPSPFGLFYTLLHAMLKRQCMPSWGVIFFHHPGDLTKCTLMQPPRKLLPRLIYYSVRRRNVLLPPEIVKTLLPSHKESSLNGREVLTL